MKNYAIFILFVILTACSAASGNNAAVTPDAGIDPTPTAAIPPTDTPVPPAATVNGEVITLESYQASLTQLELALPDDPSLLAEGQSAAARALEPLIDRMLLAQAARAAGFVLTPDQVEARYAQTETNAGGPDALNAWLDTYGYTPDTFRAELALEIEAAWQRAELANTVPTAAEQIKAHQILYYDITLATRVFTQLQNGTSFDTIIQNNDPQNLGYLAWFPRGYLLFPALEEAAFNLQPGQFSDIIETDIGYIVLLILDRQPDRPLSPEARLYLQMQALESWLDTQRGQAQIEAFVP